MSHLNGIDYSVIAVYFCILVVLGFYLQRKASASLEDYFIGGRQVPWWILGVSGMASFLDITGTMIITSFLFMLGPRGLFIEFRGGAVLVLVFMLLWTGKWHRRSGCLTGAEWMVFRFGDGLGGRAAQLLQVIAGIVSTVGMLAYLIKGVGLFLSMFLPFSPAACAMIMIGVATVYTMVSGFYGVVYTDVFQSLIILIAVGAISVMATMHIASHESLNAAALEVTGNAAWSAAVPHWHTTMPDGYEAYEALFMFAVFYLLRNVFGGLGTGGDPKFFGARNDRECGMLAFLWTWLMMVRWPMMMGFAVLGIYLVRDLFPDQSVLSETAALVQAHAGPVAKSQWFEVISTIRHRPEAYAPEFIEALKTLLGADAWRDKLQLVSYEGTVNPERILPAVLLFQVWPGFRGLLLIALIAASMSTFDSTVNATTGLFTRDIYQKYLRPSAATRELIRVSWAFIALLVGLAFLFAYSVESINDIWGWIIMGLGGGLLVPTVLRLYWWRFNGGGFAIGTAVGLTAAVLQRLAYPQLDERIQFVFMLAVGLAGAVLGTYLTPATPSKVLENFYRKTRPFGLWRPMLHLLDQDSRLQMQREHRFDLMAVPFNLLWQITLFLLPMLLVIQAWGASLVTGILFLAGLAGMYVFWYKQLPPAE